MRRFAVVAALALAAPSLASANGRAPGTSSIVFERGHETNVIAGMTFGLVVSTDSGTTWHWMCENAIGYGGSYDPIYSYTDTGAIFATTFKGLKVNRNGCTFDPVTVTGCQAPTGSGTGVDDAPQCTFVSTDSQDGSGAVYYAAADPMDGKIYKSDDDGMTFPQAASPGQNNDWWESVAAAPSNTQRVYVTGYRIQNGLPKQFLMFSSSDGGATFAPLAGLAQIASSSSSIMDIVGIDAANPDTFYVTVSVEDGHNQFGVWKTTDAGANFTEIFHQNDRISFVVRSNGDLVAGTQLLGSSVSHDGGTTFVPLAGAPHINCLVENALHELWACTANYGSMTVTSDNAGIMKTTDLVTWTTVLRYQDILAPVACAVGTPQKDSCEAQNWCILRQQLGITSDVIDCSVAPDGSVDATGGNGGKKSTGCCETGDGSLAPGSLVLGAMVALALRRRRKKLAD